MFSSKEYDLLLTFTPDMFVNNYNVIDQLHTGDIIEFTGHVTGLSHRSSESFADEHSVAHLATFTVAKSESEMKHEAHAHVHKDGRYK